MKRRRAIIGGLGLVIAALALLAIWISWRAKSPEPMRQEASFQPSSPSQTADLRSPAANNEIVKGEKRDAAPQGSLKGSDRGAGNEAVPSNSGSSWMMEQQRIDPKGQMKETSISKVWIKGDKKRVETFRTLGAWSGTALQPTTIVFSDRDYDYAYYPSEKRMLKFPHVLSLEALDKKWTRKRSEVKIGNEVIDGKPCETYRVVNDVNVAGLATVTMEVKECRWRGMVLKSISKPVKSKTGDTLVTQLKEINLDVPIPDEKFVLPTGVKIEEVKIPPHLEKSFR